MGEDGLRKYFEEHYNEIPTWDHDSLTKVESRASFDIDFPRLRGKHGVLVVDVDHLKESNSRFGHDGADLILRFVALGLETSLRVTEDRFDPVYRFGGDEFVIILPNVTNSEDLKMIAQRIHSSVTTKNIPGIPDGNYKQGLSIGGSIGDFDGKNNIEIFREADRALFIAKNNGRNRISVSE